MVPKIIKELKSGNFAFDDGRIYRYGDGIANTVGIFEKEFILNIEYDVRKNVIALLDRGYLPFSSCQGHGIFGRGHIVVAFFDGEQCHLFAQNILRHSKCKNISIEFKTMDDYHNTAPVSGFVNHLNALYKRNYENYYFVEISLGKNIECPLNLWGAWKNLAHKWDDLVLLEHAIRLLPYYVG